MDSLANLIDYIRDGTVVPIIGRDLLLLDLEEEKEAVPLYTYLARRLSRDLGIEPPIEDLNEIAIQLREARRKDSVHTRINKILTVERKKLPIPEPVRQLAEIDDFPLYISLTFDTLLQRALDEVRYEGEAKAGFTAYSCRHPNDLPEEYSSDWKKAEKPVAHVFHLLGRHESTPEGYAVTEENLLEFFYYLRENKPGTLLDVLRQKHLLVLGCNLPDWLTRLFLRLTAGRLSAIRDRYEYLAEEGLRDGSQSEGLGRFLDIFSPETIIYRDKDARRFVADLYHAWRAEKSQSVCDGEGAKVMPYDAVADHDEAVFLSYSRKNQDAAEEIHRRLKNKIAVWFDKEKMKVGDPWKRIIDNKIRACRFFMPVISEQAFAEGQSEFKRELKTAFKVAEKYMDDERYLLPVIIDDMPEEELPEDLRSAHIIRVPHGELQPQIVDEIADRYRRAQLSRDRRQISSGAFEPRSPAREA